MKLPNLVLIAVFGILFSFSAHSKPFKIEINFENDKGGIYSKRNRLINFSPGREIETFKEILRLSSKNCNKYSKDAYFFTRYISKRTMLSSTVMINNNGSFNEWGIGYMPDISTGVKWDKYRIYCGTDIEEVLVSNYLKYEIFSNDLFPEDGAKDTDRVRDLDAEFMVYKNGKLTLDKVSEKNRKSISIKIKEVSKDKIVKRKSKSGLVSTNIGFSDYSNIINKSKSICSELGFTQNTEKFTNCIFEMSEINDGYHVAKLQENKLIERAQNQENIKMKFSYETKSGQIVEKKESKWNKFWEAVGWVLYEHGDEIFAAAVDAYYGTNNSYASSNSGNTRCVQQRVVNSGVVHTHCSGGVKMYCSSHKVGNQRMVQTICRRK